MPSSTQSTQHIRQTFARSEAVWTSLDGRYKNQFGVAVTDVWTSNIDPNPGASFVNTGFRDKSTGAAPQADRRPDRW